MAAISSTNAPELVGRCIDSIPDFPIGRFAGRGIICSAGGIRYQTCAYVLFNLLRELGCTLPIICYYLGEAEQDDRWEQLVEPLGVEIIDLRELLSEAPHPRLNGWESKAYGLLHCPFEEVLLLDADIVPVRDPTFVFDTEEYRAAGAVLWPDRPGQFSEECFRLFGNIPPRPVRPVESGQVLCNKQVCWKHVNLANFYNEHSAFYYNHVHGDKDTFLMSWLKVGDEPPRPKDCRRDDRDWCFIQHWLDGEPLFWHVSNGSRKFLPYETGEFMSVDFPHRSRVIELLHQLGRRWGMAPARSVQKRQPLFTKVANREFTARKSGQQQTMDFLPNNQIGKGGSPHEKDWWITEDSELVIAGKSGVVARLTEREDGTLCGVWGKSQKADFELVPVPMNRPAPTTTLNRISFQRQTVTTKHEFAFNGSLFHYPDHDLLIYRPEPEKLASCFLSPDGNVIVDSYSEFPISHNVDPRIVQFDGRILMSTSYYGHGLDCERTELWPLEIDGFRVRPSWDGHLRLEEIRNDPTYVRQREKNWTPWTRDGNLYFTQRICPHRVCRVDFDNQCVELQFETDWKTDSWRPEWGSEFRGNSSPIHLSDGRYLSTFHTLGRGGYYSGFFTFEDQAPFRILQISSEPFLRPEDATGRNWRTGCTCVFILSMQLDGDRIRLCGGDNDHSIVIIETSLADVLNSLISVQAVRRQTELVGPGANHFTIRKDTLDLEIVQAVYFKNEYRLPDRLDGLIVVDVGAHIGSFACRCLDRGASHVACYEPVSDNVEILRHNVSAYGPRVQVYPMAVGPSNGCDSVLLREYRFAHYKDSTVHKTGVSICSLGLDSILSNLGRVDILKLDCEGMEYPILYTCRFLERVRMIVGEFHHFQNGGELNTQLTAYGAFSRDSLKDFLTHNGFKVTIYNDQGSFGNFSAVRD